MTYSNITAEMHEFFLKYYPREGSRNKYCASITGTLFKDGMPVAEIEQFIHKLSHAANDDEAMQRVSNVEPACLAVKNKDPMVGIPVLKEIIGAEGSKELSRFFKIKSDNTDKVQKDTKDTNAEKMEKVVSKVELWHCEARKGYATLEIDGSHRHYAIKGSDFKEWLSYEFFKVHGKNPSASLIKDTVNLAVGRAKFAGEQYKTWLRVGWYENAIYVDICDEDYQYIKITKDGWEITKICPVKFRRGNAKALPMPESGGSINDLRAFLNLDTDDDWILLVTSLVFCFYPFGPFPIISFLGEQGTAKTAALILFSELIDPGMAAARVLPKKEDDLIVSATNNWLVTADNVSYVNAEMSDALCRLVTGGGLTKRALYTDDEEICLDVRRPVLMTGINLFSDRQDMLDRSIAIYFKRVSKENRIEESKLLQQYQLAKPKIFGALLDIVSLALGNCQKIESKNLPRLADLGKWGEAAAPALGLTEGEFLQIYHNMNNILLKKAAESNLVSIVLIEWLKQYKQVFTGGTTELYTVLCEFLTAANRQGDLRNDQWPKNAGSLGRALKRIAPGLRILGVEIETTDKGENHTTLHTIKMNNIAATVKVAGREF